MPIEIQPQETAKADDIAFVRERFIEFNNKQSGIFPSKELHLISYSPDKEIIGGLIGDISWGWLHVDVLWVDEGYREKGIGTTLMDRAEAEAKAMGVENSFIETTDFQALGFYEKRGYEVIAQLENQPPGHVCYYMRKSKF